MRICKIKYKKISEKEKGAKVLELPASSAFSSFALTLSMRNAPETLLLKIAYLLSSHFYDTAASIRPQEGIFQNACFHRRNFCAVLCLSCFIGYRKFVCG